MRRVLKRNPGRRVANLGSGVQEVGTFRRRERNELREKTVSSPGKSSKRMSRYAFAAGLITACGRHSAAGKSRDPQLLSPTPLAQVDLNLFDDEGDRITPRARRL